MEQQTTSYICLTSPSAQVISVNIDCKKLNEGSFKVVPNTISYLYFLNAVILTILSLNILIPKILKFARNLLGDKTP